MKADGRADLNVIVIVSDTLRRDHLSFYGNRTVRTPHLDALAAQSAVFDRYYAASFPTMPARADLLLGKWTFTYMAWEPYPPTEVPLPERLAAHGYVTVGLADTPFYTVGGMGFDRGFTHFFDMRSQPTASNDIHPPLFSHPRNSEYDYCAPGTFLQAERCLDRLHDRPFFMLVDTWDPHEPWDPPAWYLRHYRSDRPPGRPPSPCYGYAREAGISDDDLAFAHDCYMAEITMVDRAVGRLLERVDSLGLAESTAILFTTDHGFYFGEHGGLFGKMIRRPGHARMRPAWLRSPLYEEIVHLPLLMRIPGVEPGRVAGIASAVDLMPTVLDLAGAPPASGPAVHGCSLLPLVQGEERSGRDFTVSSLPLANPGQALRVVDNLFRSVEEFQPATITDETWSLLYSARGESVELYDLVHDPAQSANIAGDHPDVVGRLHEQYVDFLRQCGTAASYTDPRSSL
ncbi:MAG: sulfatase [Chloroflexota bacterium]